MLAIINIIISNIILLQTYKIIFIIAMSLTKYLKHTIIYPVTNQRRAISSLHHLYVSIKKKGG